MNTQIFGCPHCSQRFQVTEHQAGQIVQCPSCAQTVEIPENAFSAATVAPALGSAASDSSPTTDSIVACHHCQGQFRVPPELVGQQVACPHCQQTVDIGPAESDMGTSNEPDEFPDFQINTGQRGSRKSRRVPSGNQDAIVPDNVANLDRQSSRPEQPIDVLRNKNLNKRQSQKNPPQVNENLSAQDSSSSTTDLLPPSIPAKSSATAPATTKSQSKAPTRQPPQTEPRPTQVSDPERSDNQSRKSSSPNLPLDEMDQTATTSDHEKTNGQTGDSRSAIGYGLLPPRFDVDDPLRIRTKSVDDFKVYLPDADGGTRQFDQRVLHVDHEGEKVSLVAQSPEEQRRRRLISNIISIGIGILVLALAFWLLTL